MVKLWFKRLGVIAANILLLYVLLNELLSAPTYSAREVDTAIAMAIENARAERLDAALQQLEALTELAGEYPQVWYNYLTVLSWDGQKAKAVELLKTVAVADAPAYFLKEMIDAVLQEADYEQLPRLAKAAVANSGTPEQLGLDLIAELLAREQTEVATDIARHYHQQFPDNLPIQLLVAKALATTAPQESADLLAQLLTQEPANEEARRLWAAHLVDFARQGDVADTVDNFTRFYQQNPDAKALAGELLILESWQENDARVVALWPDLADSAPAQVKAAAAQSLRRLGEAEQAQQLYTELLASDPDNPDYLMGSALVALAMGEPDIAAVQLAKIDRLAQHHINDVDLLEAKALTYASLGEHEQAEQFYQRLLTLKPEAQRPYTAWFDQLAQLAKQQGWAAAAPYLDQHLADAPLATKVEAAGLMLSLSQAQPANQLLAQLPLAELSKEQLETLAKLARNARQYNTALRLYSAALQKAPDDFQLLLGQALVDIDRGDSQAAWQRLEALEDQQPRNTQLLEALVYFHRRFGNDRQVAFYLERLAESSTSPGPYLSSWGEHKLANQSAVPMANLIEEFEAMLERYPNSDSLRNGTIGLMHRVGYYDDALQTGEQTDLDSAPAYVIEALGQSARELQRYDRAQSLFYKGSQRFPDMGVFPISMSLVMVDKGEPTDALANLAKYQNKFGKSRDFLLAQAYAYEASEQYLPALANYQTLMDANPNDDAVYRSWVMAINQSGAPAMALEKANQRPDIFRPNDWQRLKADRAAIAVREGSFNDLAAEDKRQRAEQALALVRNYQQYLQQNFAEQTQPQQLAAYDEIIALHSAGQFDEATRAYEQQADALALPDYVLTVVADAYLRQNQAKQANPLLEEVVKRKPNDHNANMMLFYAQVETEQYDSAQQTIEQTVDNQPKWRRNGKVIRDNPKRLAAERVANLLKAYRNQLDNAQQQLEQWLGFAPHNTTLRGDLAKIYRWRGWPNRSLAEYELIAPVAPQEFELGLGRAQTLMDMHEYAQVEQQLAGLQQDYPQDTGVKALQRRWDLYRRRELISQVGRAFGDNDFVGGDSLNWDTWLFDQPYGHNWRPFVHHQFNRANFSEGVGRVERLGAGIEFRNNQWLAQFELHEGIRGNGETGARLSASHNTSDHWQLGGELQLFSDLVPVRAINNGVDGDSLELNAQYRWHESRAASAALQVVDFSDDNRRLALSLYHRHTLFQNEHHRWGLVESAYASKNSEQGGTYFNPESDLSLAVAVEYNGLLNRYYENQLSHRFLAGLGHYQQESFGGDFTWDLEYEQTWQRSQAFSLNYGARLGRRVYDGQSELLSSLFAGVNWRF